MTGPDQVMNDTYMKHTLFAITVVLAVCAGCSRKHDVPDVTKPQTIVLKKKPGQGGIHYLTITGSGEIKGTAEISLIENGKPYRKEALSGPVCFEWKNDWYADSAELRYEPKFVSGGNLSLEYRFKDM